MNGGKPLLAENAAELKPAYFERLYGGGRYSVFMRSVVEERKPQKQADGRYLAVMLVEISFKAVQRDIVTNKLLAYGEVAAEEKKPLDITEVKLPAVMVLPDLSAANSPATYSAAIADADMAMAVRNLNVRLAKRGVTTVDFVRTYDKYTAANPGVKGAVAEQNAVKGSDAKVLLLVSVVRKRQAGRNGVRMSLKAVEKESLRFLTSGSADTKMINTTDVEKLYDFASVRALADFVPALKEAEAARLSNVAEVKKTVEKPVENLDPIDVNLPKSAVQAENTFAVIIGNEDYKYVAKVPFAVNDANIVAKYCRVTLGLPDDNVRVYPNATYGDMLDAIDDITAIADVYGGNIRVIFYYAGHGVPDESTRSAYLLPHRTALQPPLGTQRQVGDRAARRLLQRVAARRRHADVGTRSGNQAQSRRASRLNGGAHSRQRRADGISLHRKEAWNVHILFAQQVAGEWGRRDSWRTKRLRFGKGSATIGESQPQVPIAHRVGVARD